MSNSNLQHSRVIMIISGPSGSGKTSLAHALISSDPSVILSVSMTTRATRESEIEGKDYYFVNHNEFSTYVITGQLLEFTELYGNFYGTLKKKTEDLLNQGLDVLFDIDAEGARSIKAKMPDRVFTVFILPPSISEMGERLHKRSQDSQMNIAHRVNSAKEEIRKSVDYDYIIENKNFDEALAQLKTILQAERCKRSRINDFPEYIERIINS